MLGARSPKHPSAHALRNQTQGNAFLVQIVLSFCFLVFAFAVAASPPDAPQSRRESASLGACLPPHSASTLTSSNERLAKHRKRERCFACERDAHKEVSRVWDVSVAVKHARRLPDLELQTRVSLA